MGWFDNSVCLHLFNLMVNDDLHYRIAGPVALIGRSVVTCIRCSILSVEPRISSNFVSSCARKSSSRYVSTGVREVSPGLSLLLVMALAIFCFAGLGSAGNVKLSRPYRSTPINNWLSMSGITKNGWWYVCAPIRTGAVRIPGINVVPPSANRTVCVPLCC